MSLRRQDDAVEQPGGRACPAGLGLVAVCGGEEQPEVLDGFGQEEGLLRFFFFFCKKEVVVEKEE